MKVDQAVYNWWLLQFMPLTSDHQNSIGFHAGPNIVIADSMGCCLLDANQGLDHCCKEIRHAYRSIS